MRRTRGLLGALGASGFFIAAAACALLVVSALVAQHGWPGLDQPVSLVKQVGATAAPGQAEHLARVPVGTLAVSLPTPSPRRSLPARSHHGSPLGPVTLAPAGTGAAAPPVVILDSGTTSASGSSGSSSAPGTAPLTLSAAVKTGVGSAVQGTTSTLGGALGKVSPPLGQAVDSAGAAVAATVDQVTTTLPATVTQAVAGVEHLVGDVMGHH
jgi:hypothetical protein